MNRRRPPAPSLERRAEKLKEKADHELAYIGDVKILIDARLRSVLPGVIQGVYADYERHRKANVWWRRAIDRVFRRGPRMESR